jgi:hypothetical protein
LRGTGSARKKIQHKKKKINHFKFTHRAISKQKKQKTKNQKKLKNFFFSLFLNAQKVNVEVFPKATEQQRQHTQHAQQQQQY